MEEEARDPFFPLVFFSDMLKLSMSVSTKPPSGFRDFIGAESARRAELGELIRRSYRSFGFEQLLTPALENLPILEGKGGGENEKLIFKVLKRGDALTEALEKKGEPLSDMGLRFDLT